jgi:hypothetical protein
MMGKAEEKLMEFSLTLFRKLGPWHQWIHRREELKLGEDEMWALHHVPSQIHKGRFDHKLRSHHIRV